MFGHSYCRRLYRYSAELSQLEYTVKKYATRVRVAAQPEKPLTRAEEQRRRDVLRAQAADLLQQPDAGPLTIVRRYRESPSPLVRDAMRGWRSGRLDLILGGDFDLFAEPVKRES